MFILFRIYVFVFCLFSVVLFHFENCTHNIICNSCEAFFFCWRMLFVCYTMHILFLLVFLSLHSDYFLYVHSFALVGTLFWLTVNAEQMKKTHRNCFVLFSFSYIGCIFMVFSFVLTDMSEVAAVNFGMLIHFSFHKFSVVWRCMKAILPHFICFDVVHSIEMAL